MPLALHETVRFRRASVLAPCAVAGLALLLTSGCSSGNFGNSFALTSQARRENRIAAMAEQDDFPTAAQAGLKPAE